MASTFLSESIRWRFVNLDNIALLLYPMLVGLALGLVHPAYQAWAVGAISAFGFVAWLRAYRRYRAIADTPRSRLASASQGYVELQGRATLPGSGEGIGFSWTPPAVWLRYAVYRKQGGKHFLVERGQSASVFVLADDSDETLVDPEGAEVVSSRRFHEERGDFIYRGEYIAPGDTLYALGELVTEGGDPLHRDRADDVAALLGNWKRDRPFLLARYDRDGDGEVDIQEWQAAREDAERVIAEKLRAEGHLLNPVRHRLGASHGWRPYLLGTVPEAKLLSRFRRWAVTHLLLFSLAGVAALLLAQYAPPTPAQPTREVFISLPAELQVSVNGRPTSPVILPDREGNGASAFLRGHVPVGTLHLEVSRAEGAAVRHDVAVAPGERLLLITLGRDPTRPPYETHHARTDLPRRLPPARVCRRQRRPALRARARGHTGNQPPGRAPPGQGGADAARQRVEARRRGLHHRRRGAGRPRRPGQHHRRGRDRDRTGVQQRAGRSLPLVGDVLHAVRGRGFPAHHLVPRSSRRHGALHHHRGRRS
jgi:hypothetical protein